MGFREILGHEGEIGERENIFGEKRGEDEGRIPWDEKEGSERVEKRK